MSALMRRKGKEHINKDAAITIINKVRMGYWEDSRSFGSTDAYLTSELPILISILS